MIPDYPEPAPFVIPRDRASITLESPHADGSFDPAFGDHDWLRLCDQGGGSVPATHEWTSNPKQEQDVLGCQ